MWDLREFLHQVEGIGELRRVNGASWDMEVGVIKDLCPDAVLFDNIPGYPPGYRIATEVDRTIPRWLLAVNMPTQARDNALAREWKDRLHAFTPLPPRPVRTGPILARRLTGAEVDVFRFPAVRLHRRDDPRFFTGGAVIITRQLDTGRINLGAMRVQLHERDLLTVCINHGKDTVRNIQDYHARGLPCPVAIVPGCDPTLVVAAGSYLPHTGGVSEYDFAGWLRGEPCEVVEGEVTGLPIPAHGEIAIEGEILPGDTRLGGRFAEWTGYSRPHQEHAVRVKAIYHRDDPIVVVHSASRRTRPPGRGGLRGDARSAGFLWHQLELAGARGIAGVAVYSRFFQVVAIHCRYAGQARQVGHLAAQVSSGAFLGRYVAVVDSDVDPYNLDHVLWAIMRRADPQRALDIVRYCWSDTMDSAIAYREQDYAMPSAPVYNSRCIMDACRPVEWEPDLKAPVDYPKELVAHVLSKFGQDLTQSQAAVSSKV